MELVTLNIGHFKKLNQVSFNFCPSVNILTGPFSSGKSTLIHALEMMSYLALGKTRDFFRENPIEHDTQRPLLQVEVVFRTDGRFLAWEHHFHVPENKLVFEKIREGPALETMNDLLVYEDQTMWVREGDQISTYPFQTWTFRDSALDWTKLDEYPTYTAVRKNIQRWAERFCNLGELDPQSLGGTSSFRYPTFWKHGNGFTGFLAGLRPHLRQRVMARMQRYFPRLTSIKPKIKPGWVTVECRDNGIYRPIHQLGYGQLRLLALSAIPELRSSFLVLEGLEHGIYPELLPLVIEDLNAAPFQILATTYSPELLPACPEPITLQ